jgi:hypothetical protein
LPLPQKVKKGLVRTLQSLTGTVKSVLQAHFLRTCLGERKAQKTPFRLIFPFAPVRTLVAEFLAFCKVYGFIFKNQVIQTIYTGTET